MNVQMTRGKKVIVSPSFMLSRLSLKPEENLSRKKTNDFLILF